MSRAQCPGCTSATRSRASAADERPDKACGDALTVLTAASGATVSPSTCTTQTPRKTAHGSAATALRAIQPGCRPRVPKRTRTAPPALAPLTALGTRSRMGASGATAKPHRTIAKPQPNSAKPGARSHTGCERGGPAVASPRVAAPKQLSAGGERSGARRARNGRARSTPTAGRPTSARCPSTPLRESQGQNHKRKVRDSHLSNHKAKSGMPCREKAAGQAFGGNVRLPASHIVTRIRTAPSVASAESFCASQTSPCVPR
jgi:hypothetical protein